MKNELVSVIIPTFNCEKTIEASIKSILDQTYKNIEIIVVDDNCTDNTAILVERIAQKNKNVKLVKTDFIDPRRFNKRLNRNINAGYSARNTGLKYVNGQYITFQDADDISLLNRIEIQLNLLKRYNAIHVTVDWFRLEESLISKRLNLEKFTNENNIKTFNPQELFELSQKTKGIIVRLFGQLYKHIPFSIKRMRLINRFFFGSIESYPGVTGIPLFKKEVIEKIKFRRLNERIWPSFMGRGADRDFSFQVAETFKNSYVFYIPLYMWRVRNQNERYTNKINKYIID